MTNEQNAQDGFLGAYAGFVTRLIAWIIDQLILIAITSTVVIVVSFVQDTFRINEWLGLQDWAETIMVIVAVVLVVSITLLYNFGLWMLTGQTVGKWIMGVRIVRTDGGRLHFGNCVRRQIGYYISAILFLGYLWVLVDNRRQGFHDKLSGSFVVYAWPEKDPAKPVRARAKRQSQMAQSSD